MDGHGCRRRVVREIFRRRRGTQGRVVDRIGFSFDNLDDALEKMRNDGVKVTQEIETAFHGKMK
jgi:hypothetical protein